MVFINRYFKEETKEDGSVTQCLVPFLKYYTVFNWEQTRNLSEKAPLV